MKTLVHSGSGFMAILLLLIFISATLVTEFYYSPRDVIAVQQAILQAMWVYIPLILVAGGIGYLLGNERNGNIVETKKRRMLAIILVSIFLLLPSAYVLASQSTDGIRNALFYGVEIFELIAMLLLLMLLVLNARDGTRLTTNRYESPN